MGAMGDCQSKYSDDGEIFVCARGAGHLGPHRCYPWSWHEEGAMKPTVPPADSALDRASIPAMFNVLAGEIRKLEKKAESIFQALSEHVSSRTTVICDGITRIESQLTALRAEADKGRAALEQKIDALDMALETQGLQQDVIEKKLDEQFVPSETFDEWWQCVGHTHMPKRDQPPEHASIARTAWNAALRSVRKPSAARKKKQERKRRGARKSR